MIDNIVHLETVSNDEMSMARLTLLTFTYLQVMSNSTMIKDTLEFAFGILWFEFAWQISVVR
tara:strand:+ start:292 stop:477 length:186 start_codon:yes stop_codon:yes gene_type:complete